MLAAGIAQAAKASLSAVGKRFVFVGSTNGFQVIAGLSLIIMFIMLSCH